MLAPLDKWVRGNDPKKHQCLDVRAVRPSPTIPFRLRRVFASEALPKDVLVDCTFEMGCARKPGAG